MKRVYTIVLLLITITACSVPLAINHIQTQAQAQAPITPTVSHTIVKHTSLRTHIAHVKVPAKSSEPTHLAADRFANGHIITGHTPHRLILFTFDDGPDFRTTPALLDTLDQLSIRAVFFVSTHRTRGRYATHVRQAELVREIARRGHILGNHTEHHAQLPLLTSAEALNEITDAEEAIQELTGKRPWLFRPPGGSRSKRIDQLIASRGYTTMLWNLGAGDGNPEVNTPRRVVSTWKRVFERQAREHGDQGGIILLHDTHEWSVDAVPLIVENIRQRNCDLLAKNEELYDIVDDPTLFFQARQSRDHSHSINRDDRIKNNGPLEPIREAAPAIAAPKVLTNRQAHLRETTQAYCQDLNLLAQNNHPKHQR